MPCSSPGAIRSGSGRAPSGGMPSEAAEAETTTSPPCSSRCKRAGALADEVRRRTQPGVPAHAAARQQGDALRPEVPRGGLGEVARVGVLGNEDRERPPELLVQRRDDERQRRLRDARARRQRLRELRQPLVLEQLAHEREENGPLFDIPDHDA